MKAFESRDFADLYDHPSIPAHARCSVPESLYKLISASHSEEEAFKICRISLEPPRLTIRANTLKTTRQDLVSVLINEYKLDVENCKFAPNAIRFK